MSIITDLVKGLLKPAADLIDSLHTSEEEKSAAKLAMSKVVLEHAADLEETYRTEMLAKERIMVAEVTSDDKFTSRARPTIVYSGLAALGLNHIILPWVAYFSGRELPVINLPAEFWMAWGGVVGIYAWGRSREKLGKAENIQKLLNGGE